MGVVKGDGVGEAVGPGMTWTARGVGVTVLPGVAQEFGLGVGVKVGVIAGLVAEGVGVAGVEHSGGVGVPPAVKGECVWLLGMLK